MKTVRRILIVLSLIISACACAVGISAWKHQRGFIDTVRFHWESISESIDIAGIFRYLTDPDYKKPDDSSVREQPVSGKYYNISEISEPVFIPEWDGSASYVPVNDNVPFFSDIKTDYESSFIYYSEPDGLGRTGPASAVLGAELMPEGDRDDYDERLAITPSGYAQQKYPEIIEHEYLYNRCHLIAWQLGGDTIGPNLFTGTQNLNFNGMLPFENQTAQYLRFHPYDRVLYRVTPVYNGQDLTCLGVLMEACSIYPPRSFSFNVFVYNEQPGIIIFHSDGSSIIKPD